MSCSPQALLSEAQCFNCLSAGEQQLVRLSLLCRLMQEEGEAFGSVSDSMAAAAVSTWTARTAAVTGLWRDVVWAPELGIFVSVSELGTATTDKVMTSPDGINWTKRTSAGANGDTWRAVTWSPALSRFVSVAASGATMYSPDGTTWTLGTASSAANWTSVSWSPELALFVANGTDATMWSTDGITWTAGAIETNQWTDIVWAPSLSIFTSCAFAGAGSNRIATSTDGKTWTTQSSAIGDGNTGITWSELLGLFVVVATSGAVYTSSNGASWTARTAANPQFWNDVEWSPQLRLFVAVAQTGTAAQRIMSSPDGITWTARTAPSATNNWRALIWSPELMKFVAVGPTTGAANEVMTSDFPNFERGVKAQIYTGTADPPTFTPDIPGAPAVYYVDPSGVQYTWSVTSQVWL